ncbi:M14 family metallopeptidase [Candidatus Zixiibacteriota bacterium]
MIVRARILHLPAAALIFTILMPLPGAQAQVTPPEEFLGYPVGADYHLTTYETAIGYFELIAGQSARMVIREMGPTEMGRTMKYALISSEENIADLDRYREIAERMSLGRGVTPEEADHLAEEGKAIGWIDVGLHASECAPSEHAIQLAYDLVTDEDRMTRRIRDNVITLLIFANPDGMTMQAEWYMEHLGEPWESRMPWLYSKYIGHDNNRDSYNVTQEETQNISRLQNHEWFPNVVYNHHQTAPFPTRIWIPPYGEPTNPNKPAQVIRWENLIGAAMGMAFEVNDQPGAISRISFDAWYPGYMTQIATTHNIPSILTETALYRLATPNEYSEDDVTRASRGGGGYDGFTSSAFYTSPWKGGWWRIGDAVEYCLTASKAVLDVCSRYSREMLLSKYSLAVGNIERFASEAPFGWVVPREQRDPATTARMLDKLMLLGVEVYESDQAIRTAGVEYPAGTIVIPTSQPFGMFVKTMMERQDYPDLRQKTHLWQGLPGRVDVSDADPLRPYDVAGWTLPLQMGVAYAELDAPPSFEMSRVTEVPWPDGRVDGRRGDYLFSPSDNNSFMAVNRIMAAGGRVERAIEPFDLAGTWWQTGTFIASRVGAVEMEQIADETHVPMVRGSVSAETVRLEPLRLGHYAPWSGNMDEGWMRWILDEYGFPYERLRNADILAGNLIDRYNVISFAALNARSIMEGNREGSTLPEYTGGIGEEGVEHLREFVRSGGTIICNGSSSTFAIDQFDLPVKSINRELSEAGFYSAGSLMEMSFGGNPIPITSGMEEHGVAFWSRGQVFELDEERADDPLYSLTRAVAWFSTLESGSPYGEESLLSGYAENVDQARGKATVMHVGYGDGDIVLFGFNFHNRAQSYLTFKLFFNSLYLEYNR